MPYDWVEPEIYMIHDGVVVYHVYKDDQIQSGARENWFCLEAIESADAGDKTFDVRDIDIKPPEGQEDADELFAAYEDKFPDFERQKIAVAIDQGYFNDWDKDDPPAEGLGPGYAKVEWHIGDITDMYELTDEQAHDFLARNEKYIRDPLIQWGNESVLPTLLAGEGIQQRKDDDDDDDE